MATIALSTAFVSPYIQRLMGASGNGKAVTVGDTVAISSKINLFNKKDQTYLPEEQVVCQVHIMKGEVPVDFTTLLNSQTRETDRLVSFTTYNNKGVNEFSKSLLNVNPVVITSEYAKAYATGTATWFWWMVKRDMGTEIYHQIIGTLGVGGSNSDLEISDIEVKDDD